MLNQSTVPTIFKWADKLSTWFVNGSKSQYLTYTAPNHLSIVTGLFEENHGVIGNRFFLEDGTTVFDYYGSQENQRKSRALLQTPIVKGDPIWLANEREDPTRKSFVHHWPFAEAVFEKEPHRPKQYEPWTFYGSFSTFMKDVDAVVDSLVTDSNFVAWYVDQPDDILHHHGYYTGHFQKIMKELDLIFAYFLAQMKVKGLLENTNIILTADHGHAEVIDYKHVLCIRDFVKGNFRYADYQIYSENEKHGEEIYGNLTRGIKEKGLDIKVYRKRDISEKFHYKNTPRTGDILIVPEIGYSATFQCTSETQEKLFGKGGFHSSTHGHSPDNKEMRALLVMSGPDFQKGKKILEIPQNVDLYPLMSYLLHLEPSPNNGSWSIIGNALKTPVFYNM